MAKRRLSARQKERIKAIQERRRTKGLATTETQEKGGDNLGPEQQGRVVAQYGRQLCIENASGVVHYCHTRQNLGEVVCGDGVIWQADNHGKGVVSAILARRSLLARPLSKNIQKPIAANIDRILVVIAPRPTPSFELLDRYLVAAEWVGLPIHILLNKVDTLGPDGPKIQHQLDIYRTIGYPLLHTSSHNGVGIKALATVLNGHTGILVGQSGVGKSSILKALLPKIDIVIGALSDFGLGAHTTTVSRLYHLAGGGELIDSPGIRAFGLHHIPGAQLAQGFIEFRPFLGRCRFKNCRHMVEPECQLQKAVAQGQVSAKRLQSYHRIRAALKIG